MTKSRLSYRVRWTDKRNLPQETEVIVTARTADEGKDMAEALAAAVLGGRVMPTLSDKKLFEAEAAPRRIEA
jgi:hypothetical protein